MKVSKLIQVLSGLNADEEVSLEVELGGGRSEQKLFDVLSGSGRVLLISKEAMDTDPLMALPTMPNLELVKPGLPQ